MKHDASGEGVEQMDQAASTNPVLWRVDERGVAYVTLNRPEVRDQRNFQTGIAATERVLLERCKMREGGDGPTRRPRTEYTQSRS